MTFIKTNSLSGQSYNTGIQSTSSGSAKTVLQENMECEGLTEEEDTMKTRLLCDFLKAVSLAGSVVLCLQESLTGFHFLRHAIFL